MKKNNKPIRLLSLVFILISNSIYSQATKQKADSTTQSTFRGADNLKSGNYTDELASFAQLAVSDLTGNSRTFNFKSTLFALEQRGNPSLNVDTNILKKKSARDWQFQISLSLNQSNQFNNIGIGATYAVLNRRDSLFIKLNSKQIRAEGKYVYDESNIENKVVKKFIYPIKDQKRMNKLLGELSRGVQYYTGTGKLDSIPDTCREMFSSLIKEVKSEGDSISNAFNDEQRKLSKRPLWTINLNGFDINPDFKGGGTLGSVFLWGDKCQLDARANGTLSDTIAADMALKYQFVVNSSLGADIKILKTYLEIKPYIEYDDIMEGALAGETKSKFLFNADVRIKVYNNITIPLTIKYDPKMHNFLGLFNVSINMSAFGGSSN